MASIVRAFSNFKAFTNKYPISKGMIAYAAIWPIGSCIQQKIAGAERLDFAKALRFSIYGCCYVAPTLYCWIRLSSRIWPQQNFHTALKKALIEQVSYGPFAMVSFFFGMTLLEGGSINDAIHEVQVGVCVWPALQTINFTFVPETYRVVYVGFCSLMWTSFLAYMKHLERGKQELAKNHSSC